MSPNQTGLLWFMFVHVRMNDTAEIFFFQLRFLQNQPSQLIFYQRDDRSGPKVSEFYTATTDKPDELADVLSRAVGEKGKRVLIRRKVSTNQSLQNGGKFY